MLRKSILFTCVLHLFFCFYTFAQDSLPPIPRETRHDRWMWPHRTIARMLTKERVPFYDTTYIRAYKKQFVVTIPLSTRFLNFQITDAQTSDKPTLNYAANYYFDLGFSLNSKWASFLMNTGVTLFEKDEETKGKTKQTDYQFNFYGKRLTTDINIQRYKGYYISNSKEFSAWDSINNATQQFALRPDAQAFSIGLGTYYVLNYKKFSYRNSFAFTESQLRSSGSPIFGGYWSLFSFTGDSSLVGYPFTLGLDSNAHVKAGDNMTFGINIGYIYTVVIRKKVYITFSAIPGFGLTKNTYTRSDNSEHNSPLSGNYKVNIRAAAGYDSGKFFFGTMAMTDFFYFASKSNATFNYSYGKGRVFVGYRFNFSKAEKKLLRKLGLIDWNKKDNLKKQ